MKVLVTGGAGYIGSHTVDSLIRQGHQVFILDNFSTGHRELLHSQAQLVVGDIRDHELIARTVNQHQIEGVIHFAAFTSVAESVSNPAKYYDNNFQGTLGVLKGIENSSVRYFIFSSTAAVYADPQGATVTEQSLKNPITAYGRSKLMSEQAIQDICHASGLKFVILRYFNVAGASLSGRYGQIGDEHTVLIKRACLAAVKKISHLSIFGTDYATKDGTAIRDFIHVEDLADLHVLSLGYLAQGGESEILNCGYGHGFTVREVIETVQKVSGYKFPVKEEPRRPGDLAEVVADSGKLKKLFSWHPKYPDLELICRTAYDWEKSRLKT